MDPSGNTNTQLLISALNLLCFALQTIAVIVAAFYAWKAYTQAKQINKEQQDQTAKIHEDQLKLAQQQMFVPVFEQLSQIRYIDPANPNWLDVSQSANLLELIAVAWWTKLLNKKVLKIVYGRLFLTIFDQIYNAVDPETGERRGQLILKRDCPSAIELYRIWYKEFEGFEPPIFRLKDDKESSNAASTGTTNERFGRKAE